MPSSFLLSILPNSVQRRSPATTPSPVYNILSYPILPRAVHISRAKSDFQLPPQEEIMRSSTDVQYRPGYEWLQQREAGALICEQSGTCAEQQACPEHEAFYECDICGEKYPARLSPRFLPSTGTVIYRCPGECRFKCSTCGTEDAAEYYRKRLNTNMWCKSCLPETPPGRTPDMLYKVKYAVEHDREDILTLFATVLDFEA